MSYGTQCQWDGSKCDYRGADHCYCKNQWQCNADSSCQYTSYCGERSMQAQAQYKTRNCGRRRLDREIHSELYGQDYPADQAYGYQPYCNEDVTRCDDGSYVHRDPYNYCDFAACPVHSSWLGRTWSKFKNQFNPSNPPGAWMCPTEKPSDGETCAPNMSGKRCSYREGTTVCDGGLNGTSLPGSYGSWRNVEY